MINPKREIKREVNINIKRKSNCRDEEGEANA